MKKRIAILIAVVMLATVCLAALTACYQSRPAKLSKVVGTYELKSYTRTYPAKEGEETGETVDLIATNQIKAYLVVTSDGKGYYVYEDKDTPVRCYQCKINVSMDDEQPDKVKEISYTYAAETTGDAIPGSGHETLGVYFKYRTKKLSYNMPAIFGRKYSRSVRYEKVSNETGLNYVNREFGTTFAPADYEVALLDGVLVYNGAYDAASPYVYYVVDYYPERAKCNVYYALKSDRQAHADVDLTATPMMTAHSDDYDTGAYADKVTVTFGNLPFDAPYYGTPVTSLTYHGEGYEMWLSRNSRATFDVQAFISDANTQYDQYLASLGE